MATLVLDRTICLPTCHSGPTDLVLTTEDAVAVCLSMGELGELVELDPFRINMVYESIMKPATMTIQDIQDIQDIQVLKDSN